MLFRLFLPFLMLGRANFPVSVVGDFRVLAGLGHALVIYIEGALERYTPFVQETLERGGNASEFLAMSTLHPGKEGVTLPNGWSARSLFGKMPTVFEVIVVLDRSHRSRISLYMISPANI